MGAWAHQLSAYHSNISCISFRFPNNGGRYQRQLKKRRELVLKKHGMHGDG